MLGSIFCGFAVEGGPRLVSFGLGWRWCGGIEWCVWIEGVARKCRLASVGQRVVSLRVSWTECEAVRGSEVRKRASK